MKHFYTFKLSAFLLLLTLVCQTSFAAAYITRGGIRYVYNSAKTTVSVAAPASGNTYTGNIVVPESIVNSSDQTIPVVGVNSSAFTECEYLESVELPVTVTSIGDYAFDSCIELKKVTMPGVKTIGHWAFRNCYELEDLQLPETLTSIGNYCFDKNYKCTVVDLPESLTNLGGYVWEGNPQITTVICHAATPPSIKKGYLDGDEIYTLFDDTDYGDRVLYVPVGTVDLYKNALGWHHFRDNIKEITTTGINEANAVSSDLTVNAIGNGAVELTAASNTTITIININGVVVKTISINAGTTIIDSLPSGILLVNGIKVLVK